MSGDQGGIDGDQGSNGVGLEERTQARRAIGAEFVVAQLEGDEWRPGQGPRQTT